MTDEAFQKLIKDTVLAAQSHTALSFKADAEYERRFGHNPSEADDDFWIDSTHYGQGLPTVAEVTENAALHSV